MYLNTHIPKFEHTFKQKTSCFIVNLKLIYNMKDNSKKGTQLSRRGILPILGSALLLPFLGVGKPIETTLLNSEEDQEYQTLLKPDGTTVRVKVSTIKNAKVVEENVSNKSFSNWLGKKI